MCSKLMHTFFILEAYLKICGSCFWCDRVGKNLCIPGSSPILIKNARLICLPPRDTDILPLGCCIDLSAICLNINNSHFHTCLFLQFVKMVTYSVKLILYLVSIYIERGRKEGGVGACITDQQNTVLSVM